MKISKLTNLIFKNKTHYITQNYSSKHKATDYGTNRKKIEQYAIMDGYVSWTGTLSGAKTVKIIYPSINMEFLHAHLDTINVSKNDPVNKNTPIGTTGMTGIATGIHLHLAIKNLSTNTYIDPEKYENYFSLDTNENSSEKIYYTVIKGDNLTKIAKKYNTTWQTIYNNNKDIIKDPNLIYPGQKLLIK